MATCYVGGDITKGLEIFKETFRTTGDFKKSSVAALNVLHKDGVTITKQEFDTYVSENFKSLIPKADDYFRYKKGRVRDTYKKIQRELGITGKYTVGRKGKYKTGKISVEAQEVFEDIVEFAFTGKTPDKAFRDDAEIIGGLIADGIASENISMLEEALAMIKEIRETGKSVLQEKLDAQKALDTSNSKKLAEDTSRLTVARQKVRELAVSIHRGEGDVQTLIDALKKEFKITINPDNFEGDPKKIAVRAIERIDKIAAAPLANSIFKSFSKKMQGFFTWAHRDLQGIISVISRRGSKSTDGGFTETFVHDTVRKADEDIIGLREEYINTLGEAIVEAYGIKVPKFKGKKAAIKKADWLTKQIQQYAEASSSVIPTATLLENGSLFKTSKGELMQLYLDSLNPEVAASMLRAGLSGDQLTDLIQKHLTQQDIDFAIAIKDSLYPMMYDRENATYKELYHTNMPRIANYGGQVSYTGDTEIDYGLSPDGNQNRRATNITLTNSRERTTNKRILNLNRNIFANVSNRIGNSAKFVGGAKAYRDVATAFNKQVVKDSINTANNYDYHKKINDKLQELFGLQQLNGGLPSIVNAIAGNFTYTALALKPKLALNQLTSVAFWTIESSTYNGFSKPTELQGMNISKLMYDNSAALRDRYRGKNLIALESAIDAAAFTGENLLKSQTALGNANDKFRNGLMWFQKVGDSVGIMALGRAYFVGEYKKAKASGMDQDAALKEAIFRFNKKFKKTQQSYSKIDRSDLQNNSYGRLFTMFQTSPFQFLRISADSVRQLIRAARGKEYKGSVGYNAGRFLMYHSLSSVMYQFVMSGLPALLQGEWDDEEWEKLFRAAVLGSYANSIFIFGDVIQSIENWYDGAVFQTEVGQ
nr:hypothetical protein [Gammaproteobacteria bacterium]